MKNQKMYITAPKLIVSIFSVVSVILLVIGIILAVIQTKTIEKGIETTATISAIQRTSHYPGSDRRYNYTMYLNYTLEGVEYKDVAVTFYSSSMHEGDEITVYINPERPRKVMHKMEIFLMLIPCLVGVIFMVISIILWRVLVKPAKDYEKLKRRLKDGGAVIKTQLKDIVPANIRVNNTRGYFIETFWKDPTSGTMYIFKSRPVYGDPSFAINQMNIQTFKVVHEYGNPAVYYMPLEELNSIQEV